MAKLYVGAHIISSRPLYSHHGIYIGNGQVVHYSGLSDGLHAGPIETTTLSLFKGDREMMIGAYANPKYTGAQAVQRAKSRLGEDS
jgi:cell wall-associated NlpC family hydrolase